MTRAKDHLACKRKILVVDDEPQLVYMLQAVLTHAGYEVLTAYDGRGALEQVEARLPDLILLDLRMPGLDGWNVCAHLKRDGRARYIPVMIVSAMATVENIHRALRLGASDFLVKPFEWGEFLARVKSLMQTSPSGRQAVKERLTELLFDEDWTIFLVQVTNREYITRTADFLMTQAKARFVGRWSETEFVLILDPNQAEREYARLELTDLPLSLGMVGGKAIGSFTDAEHIIAAARLSLARIE